MPLSVALAGTVVAQLFDAVYAGLVSDAYDPNQRLQIALELTRLTVPLLTIQEPPHEHPPPGERRDVEVDGHADGAGATLDP